MKYEEISNAADQFMKSAAKEEKKDKKEAFVIFPADSPKVLDEKDHFEIKSENQAKSCLLRVKQYKKVPSWYKGTLESLVSTVNKKVYSKYKDLKDMCK
jgi:hypothetical protein